MSCISLFVRHGDGRISLFQKGDVMSHFAILFLVISLFAAYFGFAGSAIEAARVLFGIFLVLFVVSLVMGRRTPSGDVA